MIVRQLTREFIFEGKLYGDPMPSMTPIEIQKLLSAKNAKLTNASIDGPNIKDGVEVYTFTSMPGTKG